MERIDVLLALALSATLTGTDQGIRDTLARLNYSVGHTLRRTLLAPLLSAKHPLAVVQQSILRLNEESIVVGEVYHNKTLYNVVLSAEDFDVPLTEDTLVAEIRRIFVEQMGRTQGWLKITLSPEMGFTGVIHECWVDLLIKETEDVSRSPTE